MFDQMSASHIMLVPTYINEEDEHDFVDEVRIGAFTLTTYVAPTPTEVKQVLIAVVGYNDVPVQKHLVVTGRTHDPDLVKIHTEDEIKRLVSEVNFHFTEYLSGRISQWTMFRLIGRQMMNPMLVIRTDMYEQTQAVKAMNSHPEARESAMTFLKMIEEERTRNSFWNLEPVEDTNTPDGSTDSEIGCLSTFEAYINGENENDTDN